ncbi:MAG: flavodoxin family protein [Candidatus Lokiarchaeota archaeon]|nr:flavodoxin family protein [Candidatus Lokiarchaeota archaeon]
MKTLVVFYSLTGHSKKVAEILKKKLDADIAAIHLVKPSKKDEPQYLKLGGEAMLKIKPQIKPLNVVTTNYDLVVFGSPTWNWRPSSPVRTFFSSYPVKKAALWLTAAGDGVKAMRRFKKDVAKKSEVIGTFIAQDSKTANLEERLSNWVNVLRNKT